MPNDDLGSANQWDIVPCEPTESGMSRDLRAYQVGSQVVINDISNVSICARDCLEMASMSWNKVIQCYENYKTIGYHVLTVLRVWAADAK